MRLVPFLVLVAAASLVTACSSRGEEPAPAPTSAPTINLGGGPAAGLGGLPGNGLGGLPTGNANAPAVGIPGNTPPVPVPVPASPGGTGQPGGNQPGTSAGYGKSSK